MAPTTRLCISVFAVASGAFLVWVTISKQPIAESESPAVKPVVKRERVRQRQRSPRETAAAPIIRSHVTIRRGEAIIAPESTLGHPSRDEDKFGELTVENLKTLLLKTLTIADQELKAATLQRLSHYAFNDISIAQSVLQQLINDPPTHSFSRSNNGGRRRLDHDDWADVVAAFASIDVRTVSDWMMQLDRGRGLFNATVPSWLDTDLESAEEWLATLTPKKRTVPLVSLLNAWSEHDAEAGANWARRLANSQTPTDSIPVAHAITGAWSRTDLDSAYRWAISLQHERSQQLAMLGVAETLAETDPNRAVTWTRNFEPGAMRTRVIRQVAGALQKQGYEPQAIVHWLDSLSNPTNGDRQVVTTAVSRWAATAPNDAAVWALAQADTTVQEKMIYTVAGRWSQTEPRAAAEWANTIVLEDSSVRNKAIFNIVMVWIARGGRREALEWLDTVDIPEHRRKILMTL